MEKIANVRFSYTPQKVDELKLEVGDKIEVIGYVEEGKFHVWNDINT